MAIIYGINPVIEAIKARGRGVQYVAVLKERHDQRMQRVIDAARAAGVSVRVLPREQLARLAASENHQGAVAVTDAKEYVDVDDLLASPRGDKKFLLVLDGVEDPHNLGAIIRTADAAAADGVIIPERRAAGVNATVAKAAAGATEHMPIARVTNVGRTLEQLKKANVWTVGLDERATQSYDAVDYNMDCALVLGAEGHGLHEHVREKCDFLVSIPMQGGVPSLNVSVAAAICIFEVVRQRRKTKSTTETQRHRGDQSV
jgi:23S rRNA (guanosine2251-2'-O)-methyltransferase